MGIIIVDFFAAISLDNLNANFAIIIYNLKTIEIFIRYTKTASLNTH